MVFSNECLKHFIDFVFFISLRQYEQFQSTEYYINPSIQQHFEQFSLVSKLSFLFYLFEIINWLNKIEY